VHKDFLPGEKPEQHSQISLKIMGKHGQTRKNRKKKLGDQSWLPDKKGPF